MIISERNYGRRSETDLVKQNRRHREEKKSRDRERNEPKVGQTKNINGQIQRIHNKSSLVGPFLIPHPFFMFKRRLELCIFDLTQFLVAAFWTTREQR